MATPRVFASVKPVILVWARESAGFTLPEAARSLGQTETTLASWEDGSSAPSIPQLRELAHLYKRPLSVFYLQEVPAGFQVISDFRRTSPEKPRSFSPELTQEIRFAQQRRQLALELLEDVGEQPEAFKFAISMNQNPESLGLEMRRFFGLSLTEQPYRSDATGRTGFKLWRERLEQAGALVFQTIRIPSEEASGFALSYDILPTVVINRKDAPVRRLFSLLHELAHLGLRRSGVSELDTEAQRPPEDKDLEVFCNRVAASALMPAPIFLRDPVVLAHGSSVIWGDDEIRLLSQKYSASKESVVRRLVTFNKTNKDFYLAKREQYRNEYLEQKERESRYPTKKEVKRNMPQEALSNYGLPFVGIVMQNYHQDKLTLSEVSGYLGLRTHHVAVLEHRLGAQ